MSSCITQILISSFTTFDVIQITRIHLSIECVRKFTMNEMEEFLLDWLIEEYKITSLLPYEMFDSTQVHVWIQFLIMTIQL